MIEIPLQIRNACPICDNNFGTYFIPYGDEAEEKSNGYKLHQILRAKLWGILKPRSVKQLNTYWSCCGLVAILLSDHNNILSKDDIDFEVKIRAGKKKPALIKRFKSVDGITYISYISIAFDNMKHLEACKFFDVGMPILAGMVGMTEEELVAQAKARMHRR